MSEKKDKPYLVFTTQRLIAIKQPLFEKIDAQVKNGFAFNGNRTNLIKAEVVLFSSIEGSELNPGDFVILKGDAGLASWAKQIYIFGGVEFVLCPDTAVVGYAKPEEA